MRRAIGRVLGSGGAALLALWLWESAGAWTYQQTARHRLRRPGPVATSVGGDDPSRAPAHPSRSGAPVGQLRIARLGIDVVLAYGTDAATLARAVGLVDGTALPGGRGTVAIAGHRDGWFRPLRHLQLRDEIELLTPQGRFVYAVDSLLIVGPERGDLVAAGDGRVLWLVTCYPFHAIGPAPWRFLARARQIEPLS